MNDKTENAMDYDAHEKSYELFVKIGTYGSIASVAIVVFLAWITL